MKVWFVSEVGGSGITLKAGLTCHKRGQEDALAVMRRTAFAVFLDAEKDSFILCVAAWQ